jgi:hypothetical protein
MPVVQIRAGAQADIPDRREIQELIRAELREAARGVKWMRLPQTLQGFAANSAITLGDKVSAPLGPEQGYAWSIRRLIVEGMTAGTTPDVINLYRNSVTGQAPLWQFNGNNFGYSFGPLELVLLSGDSLKLASVGTFASTSLIRLTGELVELPGEMLGKLALLDGHRQRDPVGIFRRRRRRRFRAISLPAHAIRPGDTGRSERRRHDHSRRVVQQREHRLFHRSRIRDGAGHGQFRGGQCGWRRNHLFRVARPRRVGPVREHRHG